jgi:hypothetical protein
MAARKPWTIASARQHLPEVVDLAARAPQRIYRRDTLVAAVVSGELVDQVENVQRPSLATKFAELRRLCAEEHYELAAPPRHDRVNPLGPSPSGSPVPGREATTSGNAARAPKGSRHAENPFAARPVPRQERTPRRPKR